MQLIESKRSRDNNNKGKSMEQTSHQEKMFGPICTNSKMRDSSDVPDMEPVSDCSASSCDIHCSCDQDIGPQNVPLEVGGEKFREHPFVLSKHVAFGDIEIRKYPVILGDHPDCCFGPPITIDWEPMKTKRIPIDYYESRRGPRRHLDELKMGWIHRKQVLRKADAATDEEMRRAACEAQRVREGRYRTVKQLRFERVQLPLEIVTRGVKRIFLRRK